MKLDTERSRETPEGVTLSLRVAGVPARFFAWLLDGIIIVVIQMVLATLLTLFGTAGQGIALIGFFLLTWFYSVGFEVTRGATPGKSVLGLTVVQDDGRPIGLTSSLLRNLLRFADFLPFAYGFGLISMLLSRDFQRLGDLAAGTLVIYRDVETPEIRLPPAEPVPPPVSLSREEQRTLIDFGSRAETWTAERSAELADLATSLTGTTGAAGVDRLLGMVHWVLGRRSASP